MDEEMKVSPDIEEEEMELIHEESEMLIENNAEIDVENEEPVEEPTELETPVTEADVAAAFLEASKSLGVELIQEEEVIEEEVDEEVVETNDTVDLLSIERSNYVMQFQMDFTIDDIPDAEGMGISSEEEELLANEENAPADEPLDATAIFATTEDTEEETEEEKPAPSKSRGCLLRLVFALLIVLVSVALATVLTTAIFDITGFNRNNKGADVIIPKGADTEKVASILKDKGMINSELCFKLYCRFMNLDGKWQAGSFSLQADMGFPTLINTMQAKPPRKTVMVTFPEGLTVPEMAAILEEKKVCSAQSFINAVNYGDYDYDFIRDIPTEADGTEYAYRAYRLEGYLFPDTYEFYVDSLGETVVDRMLQNFSAKISKGMLAQIKNNGWTLDQAVIFASMVQGEGDTRENMDKVSRVLHNRLDPNSGFTRFQLCSTRDYANYLLEIDEAYDAEALKQAYNTYLRDGFPVGAINNPGLDAFNAVLYPSVDEEAMKCYYFATDYKTGITYFSKTAEEHAAVIKKYGIEDIG